MDTRQYENSNMMRQEYALCMKALNSYHTWECAVRGSCCSLQQLSITLKQDPQAPAPPQQTPSLPNPQLLACACDYATYLMWVADMSVVNRCSGRPANLTVSSRPTAMPMQHPMEVAMAASISSAATLTACVCWRESSNL